jgi:iron(III) transport system ATP-binding protein
MPKIDSVSVKLKNVGLAFGHNVVLRDISLQIEPGEFFAFLGPSGSGKSTLLRLIAGFGPTPKGQVLIGDEDVTQLPPWKRNVGMVFQNYALWPHMTVRRNVAFGLEERKLPAAEIRRRVDEALDVVGLCEYADRRPAQLSGGQQQRVALARTIVIEPRVLLLDEPLSNLDANLRIHMRQEIRELQQRLGITTIFVTHDQEEANTIADRMAVLNDGILQQVGTPMMLYDQPANCFVARFLGTANLLQGKVVENNNQRIFESVGGIRIPVPTDIDVSTQMTAMFRPQHLRILDQGELVDDSKVSFEGRVKHSEFLGYLVRYAVEIDGTDILVDDEHYMGRYKYEVGTTLRVALEQEKVRILPN